MLVQVLVTMITALMLAAFAAWWWQVRTPRAVAWEGVVHGGVTGMIADGLVLQHDDGTTVWASRGYSIYRSSGGAPFRRVAKVRPPLGEPWGGYVAALRRLFGYQELLELLPLDEHRLLVFSGGFAHVLDLRTGAARRTLKLRYFGRGKGRGMMAFGLCRDLTGSLYFAEYVTESGERPTGVWKSTDEGETWQLAYEFEPTAIRHVHAVQCDPHDGSIWIGTGDRDEHCFVGRSTDGGATFEWVGHGRQIHRTCSFAFFPDVVLWAMDADFEQNHVIRHLRSRPVGSELSIDAKLPDATYYASLVDDRTALLGVAQGVAQVWCTTPDGEAVRWLDWNIPSEPPKRGPYPGVRLARGENRSGPVHVNPLRTEAHEAAIYRFERDQLPDLPTPSPRT